MADFKRKLNEQNVMADYEEAFLTNPADSYAIFQLKDNDATTELRYMRMDYLERKGLPVERDNYKAVYAGALPAGNTEDRLEALYTTFNVACPEDYRGRSMSVSDIVALKQDGVVSCHYVDSIGFRELPMFLQPENYLKSTELSIEDDCNQLDGLINNGRRHTMEMMDQERKPSILAGLHAEIEKPAKAIPKRATQMER